MTVLPAGYPQSAQSEKEAISVHRKCPYCGASLVPGERCDCKENAAPGGRGPVDGVQECVPTLLIYQI